jgi:spermidine synthase
VLAQEESSYQSIRVVEDRRWGEPQRLLQVNEGLDSFQSVWVARKGLLGPGYYYDLFALPAWWARAAERWRVAVVGLGAGTAFRVLEGASPPGVQLELSGIEIDQRVVALGREWFELGSRPSTILSGVDGRAGLRSLRGPFDLIVLDAYQHQVEIPAHLASLEAFAQMRAALAPKGWIAINVGGFGFDDPVVNAVARTLAAAFDGECLGYRVPRSRNFVLFARTGASAPDPSSPEFRFDGPVADALLPSLSPQPCWRRFSVASNETVLVDDRSALDRLQQLSLEQARERLAAVR